MNIRLTQLGIMHLNACIKLDQKSFNGLWTKSQWKRELSDPKRICLGAIDLDTNKLLGLCSAWLIMDELHIIFLAIDPKYQRKGLGKFLLLDLIKRSSSFRTNSIFLEVKNTNEPAKAFYKSMGFKIVGNRSNFYNDGTDAILFIKELNTTPKKHN
tara:strand:+ start:103 stop:570 length:468 start_codon:yes stop_codon:yes gene_type:complete